MTRSSTTGRDEPMKLEKRNRNPPRQGARMSRQPAQGESRSRRGVDDPRVFRDPAPDCWKLASIPPESVVLQNYRTSAISRKGPQPTDVHFLAHGRRLRRASKTRATSARVAVLKISAVPRPARRATP